MHILTKFASVFGVTLLAASAWAQQSNPLDSVAETMAFDVPYGAPINLESADAAINAVISEAKKRNWKVNIAVVDSGGNLVAFKRMDGAQLGSIAVAEHKARASVKFRRETRLFENAVQVQNLPYVTTLDDVIASRGGIPLLEGGKIIGAIGCSGASGAQDETVCKVGAATVH